MTVSQVPQALVAAGSATIFSSLYASYQLYGLISSALAFPFLVATAGLTVALSLRRGPFVACLGLIGAFLVPALVHSNQPNAAALFSYLTVAVAASLLLLRYKSWWWLAWVTLAGGTGWALLWLSTPYAKHDTAIICTFLLVLLALFSLVRAGGSVAVSWLSQPIKDPMIRYVLKTAFLVVSCTLVLIVHIDGYSPVSLVATLFAATLALWLSYRDSDLDIILGIAPIPYLGVLLSWFTASAPDQTLHFLIYAALGALVFGAGGYFARERAARPLAWSGLSAAVPLLAYGLCYWRLEEASDPLKWALGAALLGAGDLLAALKLTSREDDTTLLPSPGVTAYVAGALGCSVLAITIGLQNAWLTMVLALHLPVLGWVAGRMPLLILSRLARLIAVAVLVRLAVNPNILEYPLSSTPIFNWLLYGYGAPAIAFYVAARQFRQGTDEKLVKILEAGAIFFTAALFTFELRHALGHGRMDFTLVDLSADSPQVLVWLALATGLFRIGSSRQGDVPTLGGIVLFALATAQCVIWQDISGLPLLTRQPVGAWPLANSLLIAYGLPAGLYGAIGMLRLGPTAIWQGARGLALIQAGIWMTLEMRHAFHGSYLAEGATTEAEWYAYSALWLAYTAICLGVGLHYRSAWLRKTGLLGIGLVVAKVFLFDVANLGGGWRALSFLGLGATLIATGYAYKKLAQPVAGSEL